MARIYQDTMYRGRRRLSGNHGFLYINGSVIFEISKFETKVTADRDDVIIGTSKDSKITSLSGEGSITIKQVFNRGMNELLENWKAGYDERFVLIGEVADPDAVGHQVERVRYENVWVNDLSPMAFEKGAVIEKEFSIGFTPEDVFFEDTITLADEGAVHEENGGY